MAASIVFLALAFRASRQKLKIHRLPCLARLRVATGFGWLCFICLRFALAIKAVASCSALRAVMVFAKKAKTHASPPLLHVPSTALAYSDSLSATLAPLAGRLAPLQGPVRKPFVPHYLQPVPFRFSRRRFFPDSFPPHHYHRLTVTAGIREEKEKNTIKNPADKNQKSKAKISRRTGL